ncbi:MAG: hypothetical protein ACYC8T_03460 [Myxococcaceae bacterium]
MKALIAASLLAALPALAEDLECATSADPGLAEGPVALGFFEADVATGRRACPRTELGVGGRLGLLMDTPNFYGAIGADALVFGSIALSDRTEVFGTLEALHHQWVQNATLKGSSTALGQLTLGASTRTFASGRLVSSTTARLMLPTAASNPGVQVWGAELGQAASYRRWEAVEVHGYLGADFAAASSTASADPRLGVLLNVGAQYSPSSRFGVVLDVNAHAFGATSYLAPALGLRFRPTGSFNAELDLTLPLAGSERHTVVAGLRLGYRF